jgi:altronate dehydratase
VQVSPPSFTSAALLHQHVDRVLVPVIRRPNHSGAAIVVGCVDESAALLHQHMGSTNDKHSKHETGECRVCGQAWERQQKANDNAHSDGKKCTNARTWAAPTTSTANMHALGRNFVQEVLDVRETERNTAENWNG